MAYATPMHSTTIARRQIRWVGAAVAFAYCCIAFASVPPPGDRDSSCLGVPLPRALPGCFDSQPLGSSRSCYRILQDDGGAMVAVCSAFADNVSRSMGSAALRCQAGRWVAAAATDGLVTPCRAAKYTVWRVTPTAATVRGWWVHELQFFSDTACRRRVPAGVIQLEFSRGPATADPAAPREAFDGNVASHWRAPCLGTESFDLCGCRSDIGWGWALELERCAPDTVTDGHDESACVEGRAGSPTSPLPSLELGCPVDRVSLGVHLTTPVEVGCVRVLQFDAASHSSSSLALEGWDGMHWQELRRWDGVRSGMWETLEVMRSCAAYSLPSDAPLWAEVVGPVGPAAHGESRTIQCFGGNPDVDSQIVQCNNGQWTPLGPLRCSTPHMPNSEPMPPAQTEKNNDMDSVVTIAFAVVGLVLAMLALLGAVRLSRTVLMCHARRNLLKKLQSTAPPAWLDEPSGPCLAKRPVGEPPKLHGHGNLDKEAQDDADTSKEAFDSAVCAIAADLQFCLAPRPACVVVAATAATVGLQNCPA